MFLITGYNEQEEVWYVCDSTHEGGNDGSQYLQSTMDFTLVENLFEAAVDSFSISSLWSIDVKDREILYSEKELLINSLDIYLYNRSEQPYKEVQYITTVQEKIRAGERLKVNCEGEEVLQSIETLLIRTIRYKEFFYRALIKKLCLLDLGEGFISRIRGISEEVSERWMEIANTVLINYHLMKDFDVDDLIIKVMAKEKELFRQMKRVKDELEG